MDELFQQIETHIKRLVERCDALERDNLLLTREKADLADRNANAISHIENIITRLKSIESTS